MFWVFVIIVFIILILLVPSALNEAKDEFPQATPVLLSVAGVLSCVIGSLFIGGIFHIIYILFKGFLG